MKIEGMPMDVRGYRAGEKNRLLDPEQVMWAREEYHFGRITARELAKQFGMSLDGVRRMLRGDTYANVAEAIPRVPIARQLDDGGALADIIAHAKKLEEQGGPRPQPRSIADKLLEEMGKEAAKKLRKSMPLPRFSTPLVEKAKEVTDDGETDASRALGKPGDTDPFGEA